MRNNNNYSSPGLPTQRLVNSNVDDGKHPIDLEYIKRQSQIINSQNQPYKGHIPRHINPVPNDNLIQQTRWNINAPTTRYNENTLDNTRDSRSSNNNELEASEIFTGPNKDYNPYIDYLSRRGLLNDNYKSRINTKYINIDSRGRRIEPTITKDGEILLDSDPLFYSNTAVNSLVSGNDQSLLNIVIPNHNFEINDKVIITGTTSEKFSVKALYDYQNSGTLDDPYYYTIVFQENSSSLIIKTDFNTSLSFNPSTVTYNIENLNQTSGNQFQSFDPNFRVGDGIQYQTLANYDTSDMFATLSGFTGDFIGNIPVNFLNATHRVYFVNPDGTDNVFINVPDGLGNVSKITGFYIELPFLFKGTTTDKNPLPKDLYQNMVIDIEFKYIGGIAINALNSDIPLSIENINGFQTVVNTTNDTIVVRLNKDTYYVKPTPEQNPEIGQQPINFGGNNIFISKITEINGGFINPNNYVIELPETIHNVFMVKLVNTIFPKTSRVFQKLKNNKLYWQNISDGDIVYSVEINEGSYTSEDLIKELESKMYSVTRTNIATSSVNNYIYNSDDTIDSDLNSHLGEITGNINTRIVNKGGYTNKVLFKISIDRATSITTFKSWQQADIRRPIIKITDITGTKLDINNPSNTLYEPQFTVKIVHPKHGLNIGDEVLFADFIETLGLSSSDLNKTHIVSTISSDDTYEIVIDNVNLEPVRNNTYGGYSAKIFIVNHFRILFDKNDTMGKELGFRNVGSNIAITNYNTIITNQQAYRNEIIITDKELNINYFKDAIGNQIVLTNNALQLGGEKYIYMVIREFAGSINISQNKQLINYFSKINLSEKSEDVTYNTFIYDTFNSAPITFYDLIDLQQLSIQLYGSDGELYNFNGVDHSFVLEITTLDLLPQETGINSTNNFV